jgi:hypothetical protein
MMVKPNVSRFDRAKRIAESLSEDTLRAISLRETYERCAFRKDVGDVFNNTREAWGFNVVQDALLHDLIMTLSRMHDTDNKTASIPNLIILLEDPSVIVAMKQNARNWVLNRPVHFLAPMDDVAMQIHKNLKVERADREAETIDTMAIQALRRAKRFETNEMRKSLQKFRNKYLAHSTMSSSVYGMRYNYPGRLLDGTAKVVEALGIAVTGTNYNFKDARDAWRTKAEDFWKNAIRGLAEKQRQRQRAKKSRARREELT